MNSPFNKSRYKSLLEGLDISEVPISELERTVRLDSEFFRQKYIDLITNLRPHTTQAITKVASVSDGNHFSISSEFTDDGIPYYRGQDVVGHFFIEQSDPVQISEIAYNQKYMARSHLQPGDVLLSIVGTIGESSLVTAETPSTCSCKLAILRPTSISSEYLSIFLKSKYGRGQIERFTRGAVQMGFLLADMDQVQIARFSQKLEDYIGLIVGKAKSLLSASIALSNESNLRLAHNLKVDSWEPPTPLAYTQNSSKVLSSNRLDAEYFRPRFDAVYEHISNFYETRSIGSLGIVSKGVTVPYYSDGSIPVIRSGDLSDLEEDSRFLKTRPAKDVFYLVPGDVLISSIGFGSIGKVQVFDKPGKYATVSEVTVVRQNFFNPYYLAAFLRSETGQMQIDRHITGATGQLHLYPKDVSKFWVPLIPMADQKAFETFSSSLRKQKNSAYALLEAAQKSVELAIEENESTALDYLKTAEVNHA